MQRNTYIPYISGNIASKLLNRTNLKNLGKEVNLEKKLQLKFSMFPKLCKPISYMYISFLYFWCHLPFRLLVHAHRLVLGLLEAPVECYIT